jgi:hypothetical protein
MAERGSKPVMERMSESVELVGKLMELGVHDTEPGLVQLRGHMNTWIRGGAAWSGRIEFPRYGRYADVILPDRTGRVASVDFKLYNNH